MRKSFLLLAATALLGLAACGASGGAGGGGGGGGGADVPVVEGKYTFYFQLKEGSAECPDYAGYFVTGNFNSWAEVEAPRLVRHGETDLYYAQVELPAEYDFEAEGALSYKITMGYLEGSGAPKTGVSWSYESDLDQSFPYGENPQFTVEGQKINCGTHGWEKAPTPVVKLRHVEISITFATSVPEYIKLTMPGDFNGWSLADGLMTAKEGTDRKTFTYTIDKAEGEEILAGEHELKLIQEYADTDFGDASWGNNLLATSASNNDKGNYVAAFDKTNETKGYDFNAKDPELEGDPFEVEFLPDPTAVEPITLVVVLVADAAITETLEVANGTIGWDGIAMQTTDHITFTYTCSADAEAHFNSNTGYGFAIKGSSADGGSNWHHKIQPDGNLFKTRAGDTLVTITLKEGGATYFNTETEEWDGLSADLYEVEVTDLVAA